MGKELVKEKWFFRMEIYIMEIGSRILCATMKVFIFSKMETNIEDRSKIIILCNRKNMDNLKGMGGFLFSKKELLLANSKMTVRME